MKKKLKTFGNKSSAVIAMRYISLAFVAVCFATTAIMVV
jgi:hypothetical protein